MGCEAGAATASGVWTSPRMVSGVGLEWRYGKLGRIQAARARACVYLLLPSHSPTWLKSILGVWPEGPEAKSLLVFKSRRRYLISSLDIRGGHQGTSAPGSPGKLEND